MTTVITSLLSPPTLYLTQSGWAEDDADLEAYDAEGSKPDAEGVPVGDAFTVFLDKLPT